MPAQRPNVIVFFSDQQRYDTAGCYGGLANITPHLDAMAASGTKLEYSFTVQPVCGPARSCFQTGRYAAGPQGTGCWRNGIALRDDEPHTLARLFAANGYRTGYIGKWHLFEEGKDAMNQRWWTAPVPPHARAGYQDWYGANILEFFSEPYAFRVQDANGVEVRRGGYRVDAQTDVMLEYLRDSARHQQPFFLFNSYIEPHHQNHMNRYYGPEGSRERFKNAWVPNDLRNHHGKGDWEKEWPDYLGCCASLDDNLGRLRAALRNLGLAENTIVLYCSDHGSHFRLRNGEYKRSCHEASIRVPSVIEGPGFEGGVTVRELVGLLDWPATLLDAAGIEVPKSYQGRSVLPLVQAARGGQAAPAWPQEVFVQISESHIGRAIRTKQWKYSVGAPKDAEDGAGGAKRYEEQFLYDLAKDPYEQRNLIQDPALASVRGDLRAALLRRLEAAGEARPEIVPAAS
ncbi:MAG: sulfatase-like hydrolase/transferase [Planctomycetes bacterium]|nr:sulfatase-like hydrolase/transferase [Planctomycetota bacterium]